MPAIITPQEMYRAEQRVISGGVSGFELMLRAGHAVADLLHAAYPRGDVSVLCGPGGNGGDGFVAAGRLREIGRRVFVYTLKPIASLDGDARQAAELWSGPVEPLEAFDVRKEGVVLDALFGGGLSRALSGRAAQLVNEIQGTLVAVDVPSGLDGARAEPLEACFSADLTITFAALRPAHVLSPGKAYCGEVEIVDIGVPVPDRVRTRERLVPVASDVLRIADEFDLQRAMGSIDDDPINRIDAVRVLAQKRETTVLLKSPEMIMAMPNGEVVVQR